MKKIKVLVNMADVSEINTRTDENKVDPRWLVRRVLPSVNRTALDAHVSALHALCHAVIEVALPITPVRIRRKEEGMQRVQRYHSTSPSNTIPKSKETVR